MKTFLNRTIIIRKKKCTVSQYHQHQPQPNAPSSLHSMDNNFKVLPTPTAHPCPYPYNSDSTTFTTHLSKVAPAMRSSILRSSLSITRSLDPGASSNTRTNRSRLRRRRISRSRPRLPVRDILRHFSPWS